MNIENPLAKDFEVSSSEEDGYTWAFSYFQVQLRIIKKCSDEFSNYVTNKDKHLNEEIWKDNGIGFKDWIKNVKEINQVRRISTYKNPILRFNSENPFYRAVGESIDLMQSRDLVRVMSLVFLVTIFEEYLKRILTLSFREKPEALKSCQKSMSYEDLVNFNDMSEVKEGIIEKETAIVNEDIEIIRSYIQKKFGLDISTMTVEVGQQLNKFSSALFKVNKPYDWINFKERFYRRNLIIHNSGIPNKIYRQKTGYNGNNEALKVSKEYLDESLALFWVLAFNIGLAFEEKIKDTKQASDRKT